MTEPLWSREVLEAAADRFLRHEHTAAERALLICFEAWCNNTLDQISEETLDLARTVLER